MKSHFQIKIITTICIIRHGETDWNSTGRLQGREDIELNDLGRQQALQVTGYLKKEHWDIIISSPLKRALETAQIISEQLCLDNIVVLEKLKERNYGKASGLLPDERRSLFPDGVIPEQEDFELLRGRAIEAMTQIVREHEGKHIIVVSHGAFTNSILYTISGGDFGSFKTRLKNGCLNMLENAEKNWFVKFYFKKAEEL